MLAERRGQVTDVGSEPTGNGRSFKTLDGRRQPSCGGTSRMMREYHVRICERLGVKFPGPTRQRCGTFGCCNLGRLGGTCQASGYSAFRNELGKKLEKSSGNGCMFSLMSAETLFHGKR